MDRRTALLALPAAVLAACAPPAPARPPQLVRGDYAYARAAIAHAARLLVDKQGIPGLSLALVDDQTVILAEGFGKADLARDLPATADTLYRIGSISKLFTGLEVVRLAEQGKLDLDAPIADSIPGFALRSRFGPGLPITARALLAHHSGLPRDLPAGEWVTEPVGLARLIEDLRASSLVAPPQTRYRYSNLDFSVLGRAVELLERRPFADVLRDDVLRPLGMTRSSFTMTPALRAQTARAYRGDGTLAPRMELRDAPAGSMLSSASEMALFLRALFAGGQAGGNRVLGEASLRSMLTPQFAGIPRDFGREVGLGFALSGRKPRGRRMAWHNGSFPPYQAVLLSLPEEKLGVVILAGSARAAGHIGQLAERALSLLLETKLGITLPPDPEPHHPAYTPPPGALARHAGRYMVGGGLTEITALEGRLRASLQGRTLDLLPIGPDRFMVQARALLGIIKVPLPSLTVELTTLDGAPCALLNAGGSTSVAQRVDPTPIPAAWKARYGIWARIADPGEGETVTRVELSEERGLMVANVAGVSKLVADGEAAYRVGVLPLSETEAVVAGVGDQEGDTLRVERRGGAEVLLVAGFALARVR